MGKLCGYSIPPRSFSSSNEILIHFQSDSINTRSGFELEYNPNPTNVTDMHTAMTTDATATNSSKNMTIKHNGIKIIDVIYKMYLEIHFHCSEKLFGPPDL